MTRKRTHAEYDQIIFDRELCCVPLEQYQTNHVPILHECINCGYQWKIKPAHVLAGHGCKYCNRSPDACPPTIRFKEPNHYPEKTKLYYIRIAKAGVVYYKIGITKNLEERFKAETDKLITVIKLWYFDNREDAKAQESLILKDIDLKPFRNKRKFMKNGGDTELFPFDVLNLDKGM